MIRLTQKVRRPNYLLIFKDMFFVYMVKKLYPIFTSLNLVNLKTMGPQKDSFKLRK